MFSEKLRSVLGLLRVTVTDFSRYADCDKSYISRMTSGAKTPKSGGKGARRIVDGVYRCADEKGAVGALCELTGCDDQSSADGVKAALESWLFDSEPGGSAQAAPSKNAAPHRAFGERLGALMELAGLSNVRLGRYLSIDPSYISRFRSGFRSPKANPKIMNGICAVLADRIISREKAAELSSLTGAAPEDADRESAATAIYAWLYSTENADPAPFVEGLIDRIGSFSADIKKPPLSFEEATAGGCLTDVSPVYYGIDGIRRAVIRFLGSVILRREKELFLYSDQNMDWMVSDRAFRACWASLMTMCVTGGVRITIIHNVDRGLPEMTEAIGSWLPLYPSGMIKSYYCKVKAGERFSTTLFLCPGYACISGCSVRGAEDTGGVYRFDTDPELLKAHGRAYRELLSRSGELAQVCAADVTDRLGDPDVTELSVFGGTLSLATVPEKTLLSALKRSDADDAEKQRILDVRKQRLALLMQKLKSGFVHEFVPIAASEELRAGVPMDTAGLDLRYTPKEYADHIRRIIRLSDENANYRFYVIPEAPFDGVKLLISGRTAAVTRLTAPYITIRFDHPDLCRAFVAYAERVRERYGSDRLTTKRTLEEYLRSL